MGWEPEIVYQKTVKFFLVLCGALIVVHIIIVLKDLNYTGMNLLLFAILLTIFLTCMKVFLSIM